MTAFSKNIATAGDMFAEVAEALQTVRTHLGMEVSYLTEVKDGDVVFRAVSRLGGKGLFSPGDRVPFDQTLCKRILAGDLPNLIRDTEHHSCLTDGTLQTSIPIRSHISIPIHRSNGEVYGMFCCSSTLPNTTLNQRDLDVATMFANLAAKSLNHHLDAADQLATLRRQIREVMERQLMTIHFQPIVSLRTGQVRAVEALSRIVGPAVPPPVPSTVEGWFEQARKTDLQVPFELNAIRLALAHLRDLPTKVYLSVNVSPATLSSALFRETLDAVPPSRLFVELTEHVEIAQTAALMDQIDWLRAREIGIGIDDVGAGYAGLNTILKLRPNVIKLDRSLVHGIDADPAKQSLVQALYLFSEQMGAFMIAEGVETVPEHRMLAGLGARLGQGFLYARPAPARDVTRGLNLRDSVDLP